MVLVVPPPPMVEQIVCDFPDGQSEGPGGPAAANGGTNCVAILYRSRLESSSGRREGEEGGRRKEEGRERERIIQYKNLTTPTDGWGAN